MSPERADLPDSAPPPNAASDVPASSSRPAAAWSLFILAATYFALYRSAPMLSEWWFAPRLPDLFLHAAFYTVLLSALAIVLTLILVRFRDLRPMLLSRDDLTAQFTRAIIAVLATYAFEVAAVVPYWFWFRPTGEVGNRVAKTFFAAAAFEDQVGTVILTIIAGAAAEELLFRGLLLRFLKDLFRAPRLALVTSAALFALAHLGVGCFNVVIAFWLGLVLGAICLRRGGLVTAVVAHALFNLSNLLLVPALWGRT